MFFFFWAGEAAVQEVNSQTKGSSRVQDTNHGCLLPRWQGA